MFAPHIELPWLNRRSRLAAEPMAGIGERIVHRAEADHGRERQQEDAEHRHQLERDVERDHPREGDDDQGRRKEIGPVRRVSAEVAGIPSLRLTGGQEDVAEVLDGMVERRRVAPRGHGVEQEQGGPEVGQEERPHGEERQGRDGIGQAKARPGRGRSGQSARRERHQASRATSHSMPGACRRRLTDESSLCTRRTGWRTTR